MLIEHRGKRPRIHESAYIAPNATVSGDVVVIEMTTRNDVVVIEMTTRNTEP